MFGHEPASRPTARLTGSSTGPDVRKFVRENREDSRRSPHTARNGLVCTIECLSFRVSGLPFLLIPNSTRQPILAQKANKLLTTHPQPVKLEESYAGPRSV